MEHTCAQGINQHPVDRHEMLNNLDIIIRFMMSQSIRMYPTNPAELADGNVKAVLRLVLALAG